MFSVAPLSYLSCFIGLFLYRYVRYVINLVAFSCFRPIPLPEKPSLTSDDVTVILPSLEGRGIELEHTIESILQNEPKELILVTIQANLELAQKTIAKMPASQHDRLRCLSVLNPNKRRQMARAIPEVNTKIIVFADDDVSWPRQTLKWMLAPFENEKYGGVVTCQRLRRKEYPIFSQKRIWSFLGALYLERRNFDCAATTFMDGGVPCMSGRTVAYRTKILRDKNFTYEFTNEAWWFGKYRLNADDDNFITRWMVSHGWKTYMQYHPECEVQTILEDNPKYLKQCVRWSRSNWRSNLTSMFTERHIWSGQPYSAYAVHLTTLSPPAFIGDGALIWLLWKAGQTWPEEQKHLAIYSLLVWMFISKFSKNLGHYIRYPSDTALLPVSIFFGWFHGLIKLYAMVTLDVTAWGSRAGADTNSDRMRIITESDRAEEHRLALLQYTQ
ncbi:hypothetical protein GJ744_012081 [Endocarpon pusillum]|uniref:Uncharacterized protein n=1 Tax=Endocarpon pusillum TaxID=364733 RepID=A0A8H7ACD6_9EURO|nr:hypothetical protein GJ744_012081 [Endocarpon pusillum]